MARQPIFDNKKNLFAYEALYRNSEINKFPAQVSDEVATGRVIFDSMLLHDMARLSNGYPIFINFSTESLINKLPQFMPPEHIVIEITERTEQLPQIHSLIKSLKQRNYKFALDDYDGHEKWNDIIEDVDYVKVEVEQPISITLSKIEYIKRHYTNKKIIVERVEDNDTYQLLKDVGCDYFQGFFLKKPEMMKLKTISTKKLTALRLIAESSKSTFDLYNIKKEIERDIGLTVRVLKLASNICRSNRGQFNSIRHAVTYIGTDMIRQFIKLVAVGLIGKEKPAELFSTSLFRAKFMSQMLSLETDKLRESAYLVGLVSLLDCILDADFDLILPELNLSSECLSALMQHDGKVGQVLLLCKKIELNEWEAVELLTKSLDYKLHAVIGSYREAISYADNIIRGAKTIQ